MNAGRLVATCCFSGESSKSLWPCLPRQPVSRFPFPPRPRLLWPLNHLQLPKLTRLCLAPAFEHAVASTRPPLSSGLSGKHLLASGGFTQLSHHFLLDAFLGLTSPSLGPPGSPGLTALLHFVLPPSLPRRQGQSSLVQRLTPRRSSIHMCAMKAFHVGKRLVQLGGMGGWL